MQAGSCMHIHVPGVSVTECPRCLAGEPVSLSMQHMTVYTTIVCFFFPKPTISNVVVARCTVERGK